MSDYHANALNDALRRVASSPFLAAAVDRVANNVTAIAAQLQQAVLAEVPEFSKSRNPDLLPELAHHGREHVEEIVRLLRGSGLGRFDFVHEHARRRAGQRFPLEATLHAYRSSHKVLSRWLRESALTVASPAEDAQRAIAAITDFAMEYTDAISTTFAGTYASHSLLLADVAGDQRSQLLQILLDGHDEADMRTARILRDAGFLDERQSFCVALARSVDPTEMLNASRARRLADSIEQIVAELAVRRLIDVHTNKVTIVFAAVRRDSGWTAPRSSLAKRIRAALSFVGNAALIGVSNDVPSTSHIPTAYREAAAALELASVRHLPSSIVFFCFALLALLYAPTRLLEDATPEWRLVSWALALDVVGLTLLLVHLVLGAQELKWLAFPIAYFLVAVPWPTVVEGPLIQGLTRADAGATVELLGWFGIPAMPHGNVIEVATGEVGIDEACSGIRSFQATLMISLFLGEFYRLNFPRRLVLIFGGFAMSFGFNLARMSVLVWVAAHHGIAAIERWHDPTGVTILLACFVALWGLGIFLARRKSPVQPASGHISPAKIPQPKRRLVPLLMALVVWFALVEIPVEGWYRWHERR